jgi:NACHT domain
MASPWRRSRISIRSGRLGRLLNRYLRWLAMGAVAIVVPAAIVLAWGPLPSALSGGRNVFQAIDRSLLPAVVLASAAYFWFNFWTTHRATHELLRVAQQTPEQMFPHSPEAGSAKQVYGRDQLIEELSNGVRSSGAGPQIVVGGTGSGKTTLLLALAHHLAKKDLTVPIVLSLRDKDNNLKEKDFTELAIRRFEQLVDPYLKTAAEVDRLWRWMCNRGRIVVLADDLDRSSQVNDKDPYRTQIRLALDAARRRDLPLVVTTRPSGLPPDLSEVPIDLSDFKLEKEDCAAKHVVKWAGKEGDEKAQRLVERNLCRGDLLENAFYLTLLIRLLRIGALGEPAKGGRHAVRLELLKADRERLLGKDALDEDERKQREMALREIEKLAAAWLVPREKEGFEARWLHAVRDGERLGLLTLDDRRHPQFKHEVLHAYYASRAIAGDSVGWKTKLRKRPNGARMQLTLVLTAAGKKNERFCREACDELLADVEGLSPDQNLLRAVGAAELAKAGRFPERNKEIAEGCLKARAAAGPVAKRAAVEQLETLGGKDAVEALWKYAQDDDYGTRWAAVKCLVRRCSGRISAGEEEIHEPFEAGAYKVLAPEIDTALTKARLLVRDEEPADDYDHRIVLLKQVAWMLPSLRTGVKDKESQEEVDTQLEGLLQLEADKVTSQRGLEASIAQGFKADAMLHPEEPIDNDAKEMLKRAVFWYSQLNLVHALALRMANDPEYGYRSLDPVVIEVKKRENERRYDWKDGAAVTGDLHPMLCYALKLCETVLKGKDSGEERVERMKRVVWEDEGVVVSGRPRGLERSAAQLVGEITVLLNLNETGTPERRQWFGEEVRLPHCMGKSLRRREFHDGCHEKCDFQLCPFQPARDELSAHRELSRAFCRDQRMHAKVRRSWRWGAFPIPLIPRVLPQFWRRLEAQARF